MARAYNQAQKFGVEMAIPDEAIGLNTVNDSEHNLDLEFNSLDPGADVEAVAGPMRRARQKGVWLPRGGRCYRG
jgi:hypothetical protein